MAVDQEEEKRDSWNASTLVQANILSKPVLFCVAFVAGMFIASVSFNLAMYFSLRAKTNHLERLHDMQLDKTPVFMEQGVIDGTEVNVFNNIVMIEVQYGSFNKLMPWQTIRATFQEGLGMTDQADSSGLILERGLVLTSAYVAIDSIMITVQRQGESKKYAASIVTVATDLDLALLNVTDSAFWNANDAKVSIPATDQITGLSTAVTVAGFPVGADLSISKLQARVARIGIDASGSSGRYASFPLPVLKLYPSVGNDLTVGPVFDSQTGKLAGFIGRDSRVIPVKTLSAFVESYKRDKKWSGLGMLGMLVRPMQPLALRRYWDLPDDGIGVQIRSVCKDSQLQAHQVKKGDILREIDGEPVMANGAIIYRKSQDHKLALPFPVLLGEKMPGESTTLTIFRSMPHTSREGTFGYKHSQTFNVTIEMKQLPALVPRILDENRMQQPTYFILGGLVWTVFTEGLLEASKALQQYVIPASTQAFALHRWRENPEEEIVVLLSHLEHPCNKLYNYHGMQVLKYFNGREVFNMKQFVQMVGEELTNEVELLQFAFLPLDDDDTTGSQNDPDIVLDVGLCTGADMQILEMHQIPSPFSTNLLREYVGAKLEKFAGGKFGENASQSVGKKTFPHKKKSTDKSVSAAGHVSDESSAPTEGNTKESGRLIQNIPWFNVVHINMVSAEQDFISPWKTQPSERSSCSAIIIDKTKRLILTNSHCVGNAKSLDVMREDDVDPVPARVVEIAHDVDLAWITTDDAKFWQNPKIKTTVSMSAGPPSIASGVRVVGYPTGGSSITITQGIVSRIDGQIYPNGLFPDARNTPDNLLIVQVDAAINSGNSGGPVFDADGNLLGLAFAALQGAQNTGYVIPNIHCRNFIRSIEEKGRWQAQSETGALFRRVENLGIRKFLRLKEDETGVQVRSVSEMSPLWAAGVRKGDVLLKIAGTKIEGAGSVLREINGHKVSMPFDTLVTEMAHGEKLAMDFVRPQGKDGKPMYIHVDEAFHPIPPLVPRFFDAPKEVAGREHFAANPSYFMVYGLVFGVLSNPVLQQAEQRNLIVPWTLKKKALHNWLKDDREEVVVLLQGLTHPCNMYYDFSSMRALDYFNGQPVKNLKEFMQMAIADEIAGVEYMRFTFLPTADADAAGSKTDPDIVLHRDMCAQADKDLMKAYNIESWFSSDLSEAAAATILHAKTEMLKKSQEQVAINSVHNQSDGETNVVVKTDKFQRIGDSDGAKGRSWVEDDGDDSIVKDGPPTASFMQFAERQQVNTEEKSRVGLQQGLDVKATMQAALNKDSHAHSSKLADIPVLEPASFYNGVQKDPVDISPGSSDAVIAFAPSTISNSSPDVVEHGNLRWPNHDALIANGFGRRDGKRLGILKAPPFMVMNVE